MTSLPGEMLTARGLERRLKRHLKSSTLSFAAITIPGLEAITAKEICSLADGCIKEVSHGIVAFCGSMDLLYKANLHCRTASRILMRIDSFTTRSYPELYNKISKIRWELYCGFASTIAINVSSRTSRLHHTENMSESTLCAIQDHMKKLGVTIVADKKAPIAIYIRLNNDECTVSIDATGTLLYKRGIRMVTGRAPLRETTASALLHAALWAKYPIIADPCCGSGAIICEAILLASQTAPGLQRDFAFSFWPSYNEALWLRLKKEAQEQMVTTTTTVFYAGDSDELAVENVTNNCKSLPLASKVTIACSDCLTFNEDGALGNKGLLISNLPFGKRVKTADASIDIFYQNLGTALRRNCRGWNFAFLIADSAFEKKSGLKAKTALSFSNGGITVRLVTGFVG